MSLRAYWDPRHLCTKFTYDALVLLDLQLGGNLEGVETAAQSRDIHRARPCPRKTDEDYRFDAPAAERFRSCGETRRTRQVHVNELGCGADLHPLRA